MEDDVENFQEFQEEKEEEEEDLPPILRLPNEILVDILEQVGGQKELLSLRLVCKRFSFAIEENSNFSATLEDEAAQLWPRILNLRLSRLKISSATNPLLESAQLCHPNLLKSLQITSKISSENFSKILQSSPDLQELSIELSLSSPLFDPDISTFPENLENLNFNELQSLEISVCTRNPQEVTNFFAGNSYKNHEVVNRISQVFSQLVGNTSMRKLRHLKFNMELLGSKEVSQFSAWIFHSIGIHWKTLEFFDLELSMGNHPFPCNDNIPIFDSHSEIIDFELLKKSSGFQSIRLVNSSSVGFDLWEGFLKQQKGGKLENLEVDMIPMDNKVYRDIMSNNCDTLTSVDLSDVSVWDEIDVTPLNLSIFSKCLKLKKLTLDRNATRRRLYGDSAEIVNLFSLPTGIEELSLNYFNVLSDELVIYLGDLDRSLKNFSATQCGTSGDFGIDGAVLEAILQLSSIEFVEISGMNFSDPLEALKLNMILTTFGYKPEHPYFQLKKVPD